MKKPQAIVVSKRNRIRKTAKKAIEETSKDTGICFDISDYETRTHNSEKTKNAQLYVTTSLRPGSDEQRIARNLRDTGCARILFTSMEDLLKEHDDDKKSSLLGRYMRYTFDRNKEKLDAKDVRPTPFKLWFRENVSTFDDIAVEGDVNSTKREFQLAIERVRKERKMKQNLNIGIIGLGKLGRQLIHGLKSKKYIETVHAFSDFAKKDYNGLIIPRMGFEGDERSIFEFHNSLESLLETNPNPLIIATGEYSKNIGYSNYPKIKNLTERLMKGSYPKAKEIFEVIKKYQEKGYDGLTLTESNPVGPLLQVAKEIGIPIEMLSAITSDNARHKTLLLERLQEQDPTLQYADVYLDVIGEHGREIPLLTEAQIKGKLLMNAYREFKDPKYREALAREGREIGLKLMINAEELGDNYGGITDTMIKCLEDFAYLQRDMSSTYSYFNSKDDFFIGAPSRISYPLRIHSIAGELDNLIEDEGVINELIETIDYQKKLVKKYHSASNP